MYKLLCDSSLQILPFRSSKIVVVGDSAGGNFATSMLLMILHANLPRPIGLILIYPNLDYNIHSWMSDDQMALFKSASMKEIPSAVLDTKQNYERRKSVLQVTPDSKPMPFLSLKRSLQKEVPESQKKKRNTIATRLAMTSRVAFSQDRIITTELMRAMAILYIGPKNKPNFDTDYLLSPVRAPSELLGLFPKTYLICGEKDPLVDDTIVMAGRIREAKHALQRRRLGINMSSKEDSDREWVEMMLIRGVSHGFLQMTSFLKEGRVAVDKIGTWLEELFTDRADEANGQKESRVIFSLAHEESVSESDDQADENPEGQEASAIVNESTGKTSVGKQSDQKRHHYRHDTWESKNVLKEQQLMERRREALTRGLGVSPAMQEQEVETPET